MSKRTSTDIIAGPSSGKRRMGTDVMKLTKKHAVKLTGDSLKEFTVTFDGPKETPYEGGVWQVKVVLPKKYPFQSPRVGFVNKIFHPNINLDSGAVCLDVINQVVKRMIENITKLTT